MLHCHTFYQPNSNCSFFRPFNRCTIHHHISGGCKTARSQSLRLFFLPPFLTSCSFAFPSSYKIVKYLIWKCSQFLNVMLSFQESSSTFKVWYCLSKYPHFCSAYVVGFCNHNFCSAYLAGFCNQNFIAVPSVIIISVVLI